MKKLLSLLLSAVLLLMSAAYATEDVWTCEVCGTERLTRNFCPNCGAPRPSREWICPNCGSVNETKFCPECGTQKPDAAQKPSATQTPADTPNPATMPVLRADPIDPDQNHEDSMVWGTDVNRNAVRSVTFLSTQGDAPTSAVDVSEAGDRGVLLWFEKTDDKCYDIYLAANGKMQAPKNCFALFQDYTACTAIHFNGVLDTADVAVMALMFYGCETLTELDLSSFDTSNVTDMSFMFCYCEALDSIDLASFDTSNVTDMSFMFCSCEALDGVDLGSFDTSNVSTFEYMFGYCSQLQSLNIDHFVVDPNANVDNMFEGCTLLSPSLYAHFAPTPAPYAVLTPTEIMTPSIVIGYMDQCIRAACDGYAKEWQVDADELFQSSRLTQTEQKDNIVTFGNSDWSIEMYFVYEESYANVDAPAGFWSVAMRDDSASPTKVSHCIAVSSVIALLYSLDPQIDVATATDMIERGEDHSAFEGDGYRLSLLRIDDTETQLVVELI